MGKNVFDDDDDDDDCVRWRWEHVFLHGKVFWLVPSPPYWPVVLPPIPPQLNKQK